MCKINISTWILIIMAIVYTIPIIYISYTPFCIGSPEPIGGGIMVQYQVLCQAHIVNFT